MDNIKEAVNLASDQERIDLDISYKYHIKESNSTITLKDILQKTFSEYSSSVMAVPSVGSFSSMLSTSVMLSRLRVYAGVVILSTSPGRP